MTPIIYATLNTTACLGILAVVVCRGTHMSKDTTRPIVRALYALLAASAVASGGGYWLWTDTIDIGQLLMSVYALSSLIVWRSNWRFGQPPEAEMRPPTPAQTEHFSRGKFP